MKCEAMIKKDPALYADLIDALEGGRAHIVFESEAAVLARYNDSAMYMLGAEDEAEGRRLLDGIDEPEFTVILRGESLIEYSKAKDMWVSDPCFQVFYKGEPLDDSGPMEIRRPAPEDFEAVAATYSLTSPEELRENFEGPDFFCGYLDGKLAAYAGMHSEGSLGMLHVFGEYRGMGLSKQMSRHMVNHQLKKGRLPYAQVFCDNTVSLGLQRRNGMTFSDGVIAWAFRGRKRDDNGE